MNKINSLVVSDDVQVGNTAKVIKTDSQQKKARNQSMESVLSEVAETTSANLVTVDIEEITEADWELGVSLNSEHLSTKLLWQIFDEGVTNLVNSPNRHTISELRGTDVSRGQLVTFEAEVTSASEVVPIDGIIRMLCEECHTPHTVYQDITSEYVRTPQKCRGCEERTDFHKDTIEAKIASQSLIAEELLSDTDGQNPADITVHVHDNLTGVAESGDRVEITGIVYDDHEDTAYNKPDTIRSEPKVFALGINKAGEVNFDIDDETEARIREIVSEPDFYERLHDSIAPNLVDLDAEKRGLVAAMMTGGDIAIRDDTIRGDSNVLLIGDPDTGKSALIKWINKITPRGDITSAENSSGKGLTATAVEDTRLPQQWVLKAGHLVRSNGGVACIDELDKGEELTELHTPLESGEVWRDVAGQSRKMQAKCRVFAAANPEDNVFDDYKPLADQFSFPPSILSRFDLVYAVGSKTMDDIGDDMADSLIDGITEAQGATDGGQIERVGNRLSKDWLTQYVYLAWDIDPRYSSDALATIKEGWKAVIGDDGAASGREFESLLRLSKGLARVRLSETVDVIDAERALDVWKESLDTYALAGDGYDLSIKNDGMTSRDTDIRQAIRTTIDERESADRGADIQDVYDALAADYDTERVAYHVSKLREAGVIYRPDDDDHYRLSGDA